MALEDISAAVTGFSQGMGLMNDWERQRLAVERERRLSEQAAQAAQLKQMGLTREILGEYGADAPQVMQAVGLPAPDAGLVGIFNRRAGDEQLAARYAMDPAQVAEQLPNLPAEHPLWRAVTRNPELRAAVGEERKLSRARAQSREAATSYEAARGADQQMSVPEDMSVIERTALARAHSGDRKLLDDLLQRKMAAEASREALQGIGSSSNQRMTTTINSKGEVTRTLRPESSGQSTSVEREARALTQLQLQQMGEEMDPTNMEHMGKLARIKSYLALRPRGAAGTLLAQQLIEEEGQGQVSAPAQVAERLTVLQRDLQAVNQFTVLRERVVAQMRQDPRMARIPEGSPQWNQIVSQRTNDAYLAQTPLVQPEGAVVTTRGGFLGGRGGQGFPPAPQDAGVGVAPPRAVVPQQTVAPVVTEPPQDVMAKRDSLSRQVFQVPYAQLTPVDKARVDKRLPAPTVSAVPRGLPPTGPGGDIVAPGYVRRGKTPGQGEREDMASLVTTLNVTEELLNDVAQNPLAIRTFGAATQNPRGALRRFGERNLPEQYRNWTGGKLSDEELAYRAKTGMIVEQLKTELIGKQRTIPELKGLAETLPDPEQNDPRQFVVKMRELFKLLDQKLQGKGYVLSDLGFKSPAVSRSPRALPGR